MYCQRSWRCLSHVTKSFIWKSCDDMFSTALLPGTFSKGGGSRLANGIWRAYAGAMSNPSAAPVSKSEPAVDQESSTNPFVNLLRSRKFLLAVFAIASWIAGLLKYDLDPTLTMGAISVVISILIYSIAKEDASAKHASMAADADLERMHVKNDGTAALLAQLMPTLFATLQRSPGVDMQDNSPGGDMQYNYKFTIDMTDEEIDEEIERAREQFDKHLELRVASLKEVRATVNPTKKSNDTEH